MTEQAETIGMECCDICKFWEEFGKDFEGRCLRHAPRPITIFELTKMEERDGAIPGRTEILESASWPVTYWEEWCGEFVLHKTRRLKES